MPITATVLLLSNPTISPIPPRVIAPLRAANRRAPGREADRARIFAAQRNALDKAKAVQETVNQSAGQRDQQSD